MLQDRRQGKLFVHQILVVEDLAQESNELIIEHPGEPVSISDLHASIFAAMGISPSYGLDIEKRPFYVTEDGKGKVVKELFATSPV